MKVWAAPLRHRDLSCWGYVVEEQLGVAEGETAEAVQLLRPRRLAVLGDTSDSSALVDVATNVDAMVHEATYLDADTFERGSPFLKGHSSARMAGAFAKQCNAHHLLLTHFSKRYAGDHSVGTDAEREMQLHVQQAREAIGHKRVYAAQDFQIYHVAAAAVAPTSSSSSSSSAPLATGPAGSGRNRSAVGSSRSASSRSVL
jgi:ribonuclease BN (tRNA processing enzyme)